MGSKTGGVPGVRAYVALLRRGDDREFVVVIVYSDPTQPVSGDEVYPLAWRTFELLAEHDRHAPLARSATPREP